MATVKINALPQFKPFWGKHRYKIAVSGRASGKSVAAADAALTFMMRFNIKILQARQYMVSIADSSYQQVVDRIEAHGLEHCFEIQKNRIICTLTGAEMIFKGLERNITNIKSMSNIDIVIVEEAETVSDESWKILIPTITRNKGAEIWVLFNPKLPTDATAKLFLGDNPPAGCVFMRANYDQNPYLPQSMLDDIQQMKDTDYKRYLHVYGGQFEDISDMKIFPFELIKSSIGREVEYSDAPRIAALDVARFGDDSSALCIRQGNIVETIRKWQGLSTTELSRAVADVIMGENLVSLVVDGGGGHGSGPIDQLREMVGNACNIIEFNGSHRADDTRYANARAETHYRAKEWLQTGRIPNEDRLVMELSSIEYKFNTSHAILVEKKEDFKKRNAGISPDHLDAFTMTFYTPANTRKINLKKLNNRSHSAWT